MGKIDGSTSRTLILLAALLSATMLAYVGKIDSAAYTGLVGIVLGGVVHASGAKQGVDATTSPPPPSA